MISHEHRCIFVHFQRTGGTVLENRILLAGLDLPEDPALRRELENRRRAEHRLSFGLHRDAPDNEKHWTAAQVMERYPREWKEYFKFAFVRNPWDLVVSLFYQPNRRDPAHPAYCPDFGAFVRSRMLGPSQFAFLATGGAIELDFVGRYETFEADTAAVLDRLGIGGRIRRLDDYRGTRRIERQPELAARRPYPEYYTWRTRRIVAQHFAEDVRHFGYRFDG